jgi:hypothetical protein
MEMACLPPATDTLPAVPAAPPRTSPAFAGAGTVVRADQEGGGVLLTNHVLSGALIGALARRPLPAFAVGVASHFALDAVPHWGKWGSRRRFLRVAVVDGLISLAVTGSLAAVSPADRRLAVLAGITGAALPDLDKPARLWFGSSPFPRVVNRFHGRIQREEAGRARLELFAAAVLAVAALAAIRGRATEPGHAYHG